MELERSDLIETAKDVVGILKLNACVSEDGNVHSSAANVHIIVQRADGAFKCLLCAKMFAETNCNRTHPQDLSSNLDNANHSNSSCQANEKAQDSESTDGSYPETSTTESLSVEKQHNSNNSSSHVGVHSVTTNTEKTENNDSQRQDNDDEADDIGDDNEAVSAQNGEVAAERMESKEENNAGASSSPDKDVHQSSADNGEIDGANAIATARSFVCNLCEKSYLSKTPLLQHIIKQHGGNKMLCEWCCICKTGFNKKSAFKRHMKTHAEKTRFDCSICDKTFCTKQVLKTHMLSRHSKERPHLCSECGRLFARKGDLVEHSRTHTGVKPYKCEICNESFTQRTGLGRHMSKHRDDMTEICPFCGKKFAKYSSHTFKAHILSHTGEKPHQCEVCKKAFIRKQHLVRHMRMHTGERPYACELCDQAFTQRTCLKLHMKKHSGNATQIQTQSAATSGGLGMPHPVEMYEAPSTARSHEPLVWDRVH